MVVHAIFSRTPGVGADRVGDRPLIPDIPSLEAIDKPAAPRVNPHRRTISGQSSQRLRELLNRRVAERGAIAPIDPPRKHLMAVQDVDGRVVDTLRIQPCPSW